MTYKLIFLKPALKEWEKLDATVKSHFKNKLKDVLKDPHITAHRVSGMKNAYKIKLRSAGFRLVYTVRNDKLIVLVVAVGKRNRNWVYRKAVKRV